MDPLAENVPQRSEFWFSARLKSFSKRGKLFDKTTLLTAFLLGLTTFIVFWPVVLAIEFEEAFFTPLVPLLLSIFGALGIFQNLALKILFMSSLVFSTVGIYFLVRDLTKRQVAAIFAAALFLIPPVPIFVLSFIRSSILSPELISAKSFFTVIYGDGAHFLALAVVPYTLLFYLRFLKSGEKRDFLLSVFALVIILLANRSQSFYVLLILSVATLCDMFLGLAREKLKKFILVLIFCAGLVSFWYTPYFWLQSVDIAFAYLANNIRLLFPLPFIIAVLSLLFSFVFFGRREDRQGIFISMLSLFIFLAISIDWILNGRSFLPHPQRLLPDLFMFLAISAALTFAAIFDKTRLEVRLKFVSWPQWVKMISTLLFAVFSFIIFGLIAYLISPFLIFAVSGPGGVWTKLRDEVIADREKTLEAAGGSFRLVSRNSDNLQELLSIIVSIVFVLILVFLLFNKWKNEKVDEV